MNKRIEKKKIVILALAILVVGLVLALVWYLMPRSLDDVITVEREAVTGFSCNASVSGIDTNGAAFVDNYVLRSSGDSFDDIMDILYSSDYRQDIRNLLPCAITAVDSDANHDGRTVNVLLAWGSSEEESCYLSFAGSSVTVSGSDDGLLIYHPTDSEVLDKLADYIQLHGTVN